jgi:type VI protein secretion system component VasK
MSFRLSPTERAKTVRLDEELPASFRDKYWGHVRETLVRVFKKDVSLADNARHKLDQLEAEKGHHTVFYHASPLEVAADLAEVAQITPEQKAAYLELQQKWNLAEPGEDAEAVRNKHLGVAHPEA